MPFLYFPKNKLEYIPAGLSCLLFILGAVIVWRIFVMASRREQQRFEQMEQKLKEVQGTAADSSGPK